MHSIKINNEISIGGNAPLALIAGPCVIENVDLTLSIAGTIKDIACELNMPYIFKASFDKANRSSIDSFRGPGLEKGLKILAEVKSQLNVPVLTDIHLPEQAEPVSEVVDILQIPAFLCRQTDLIVAAARAAKVVNIKKGQFLSPLEMKNSIEKCYRCENHNVMITERGTTFGYNNLVNDMRALPIMRAMGVPVVYDATHSVQLPGGQGTSSGGQREFVRFLSRSAVATGCDAVFFECHPDPENALCDGANSLPITDLKDLLSQLIKIDTIVKGTV